GGGRLAEGRVAIRQHAMTLRTAFILGLAVLSAARVSCADDEDREPPPPRHVELPETLVAPATPLDEATRKSLQADIAALASLDKPIAEIQDGLNGSMVEPPPGFHRLVRAGPDAIPLLLAHLDDATPTKLLFTRAGMGIGGAYASPVIPYDPLDEV